MPTPADNRISAVDGPHRNTLRIAALRAGLAVAHDYGVHVKAAGPIIEAAFYAVLDTLDEWELGAGEQTDESDDVTAARHQHVTGEWR